MKNTKKIIASIAILSLLTTWTYATDFNDVKNIINEMTSAWTTQVGKFWEVLTKIFNNSTWKIKKEFISKVDDSYHADDATHATNADDATHATNADNATHATNADDATHATNADNATHATNADDATHATNSDKLDWHSGSYYQKDINWTCPSWQAVQSVNNDGSLVCINTLSWAIVWPGWNVSTTIANNKVVKSNGTDLVASSITDNWSTVIINWNVWIGTTSPRKKLDVNWEIIAQNRLTLAQDSSTTSKTWHLDNSLWKFRIFEQPNINTAWTERLVINNWNVWIGTNSPSSKLDITWWELVIHNAWKYTTYWPRNTSYSHFYTDADVWYYFNKWITVDTWKIASYNENLDLGVNNSTKVSLTSEWKFIFWWTSNRRWGIYWTYDYRKAANIWSMWTAYQIAADGSTLGNLYWLAYKYSSYGWGWTLAWWHQMVWAQNWIPYFAAWTNVWVRNNVYASAFIYNSDKRLKKNIKIINNSLEKIKRLRWVSFEWRKDWRKDIWVIAQEVEKVFPELVHTDDNWMKSVEYGNLVWVFIEGIKELYNKVNNLASDILSNSNKIEKLEKENKDLKNRLNILEKKMDKILKQK